MAKKQKNVIEVLENVVAGQPSEEVRVVRKAVDPEPEPAVASEHEPKKRGGKAKAAPAPAAAAPTIEPFLDAADPAPKASKRKRAASDATLHDVFEGYLRGLEDLGKSNGTILSYRMELALAENELGAETKIADLDAGAVAVFFGSDRVTRTRSGRGKSPLTIDKTRRVVRQALVWAEANGMVAKAPLPEAIATH